jgi:activating signal cointegrator 1
MEYKVLTLWQPWASLLVHGVKQIETRPKPTSWTVEKGIYLIHAASKWSKEQIEICKQKPFHDALTYLEYEYLDKKLFNLPLGQIIGAIEVTKSCNIFSLTENMAQIDTIGDVEIICEPELSFGDYRTDRFAWLTKNPRILKEPIPYKGGQGYYVPFKGDESKLIFL